MITADAAGTWKLGDLTINKMGFGAMRVPRSATRDQAIAVLRRAAELGVNHIDTAAFYFSPVRSANELINSALSPYPDDLVIATKVWAGRDPSGEWYWASPGQLRGQVEENLRQLGRDHLDVVNLRIPRSAEAASIGEHFAALAVLRADGMIRHLGLSNVTVAQIDEALAIAPVVAVQNRYSIDSAGQEAGGVVRACAERAIAFVPFFPIIGDGRQGAARPAETGPLLAVARARDVTPAQIRLAWTLAQGQHVLAIPGTSQLPHLTENIAAGALRLSAADLALLATAQARA
jgi:aryl-alcohol dehydrogenase-like predicted oxidoreductase